MNGYLKIIRLPNLLIIILTQYLLRFCIIDVFYGISGNRSYLGHVDFALLVLSTLLIAAGGYVINDYHDVSADKINKPAKTYIGNGISLKSAFSYYLILTLTGIIAGFIVSLRVKYQMLGFVFIAIALLLWLYSIEYRKTALWGNLVVAVLSAMVLLIVWIFEFFALHNHPVHFTDDIKHLGLSGMVVTTYAIFAFLISLIREIVKDMEDLEGDAAAGFRTMPVAYGTGLTGKIVIAIALFTIVVLGFCQVLLIKMGLMLVFWYILIVVQSFLIFLIYCMVRAKTKEDYHFLSNTAKMIMLAGILSMQLFYISY